MTIGRKLQLGFLGSALSVAIVGGFSVLGLSSIGHALRETRDKTFREVSDTNQAAIAAAQADGQIDAFIDAINEKRPEDAAKIRPRIAANFVIIFASINDLRDEANAMMKSETPQEIEEEKHLRQVEALEKVCQKWQTGWREILAGVDRGEKIDEEILHRTDEAAHEPVVLSLQLQTTAGNEILGVLAESVEQIHAQWFIVLGVGAAAILVSGLMALITAGPLSRKLNEVRAKAALLGEGDLAVRISATGNDEIAKLAGTFNHMAASLSQSQAELVDTARRALDASRAKSAFLANMSHEIRTPMTAIMGYSETLLDPEQNLAERNDALQIIRRNARHLLELINDVLDISKIEADKMTVERVAMDLPQITADVVSLMRPRAIAKGLNFHLSFGKSIPRIIRSDPLRIKQILMNLVGNAVKFTERGEVRLRVNCERTGDSSVITFEVADTGIGMTREQIGRLFQPFTQADESMTRRFGGSGLGLTISKQMAKLLGGAITIESVADVGSKFSITIDGGSLDGVEMIEGLNESMVIPAKDQQSTRKIKLQGRILVAEDGPDNQRLIALYLRKAGAEVFIAENGRIAIDMATTQPIDLILMDMQMPELDGYAATSELRKRGCTIPIIALTAHAMTEDRGKCIAAGCTDYLAKPIDKNTLLTTLAGYLKGSEIGEATTASAAPTTKQETATGRALRSTMGNDPEMGEAIQEFIASLPSRVSKVNQLLDEQNLAELHRVVHQIKGAGGGYGFDRITKLAAHADRAIKQGDAMDKIKQEVETLVALVRSVEGYEASREQSHA